MENQSAQRKLPAPKGGARPGAGRPIGAVSQKSSKTIKQIVEDGDVTPIIVMVENMRHYYHRAESLTKRLDDFAENITAEDIKTGSDRIMQMLKMIEKVTGFRMKAQECAVDAAPYCHPRLANIEFKETTVKAHTPPTKLMSPKEAMKAYMDSLDAIPVER